MPPPRRPPRRPPTPEDLAAEVRRRMETEAMRHGPAQDLARLLFRAEGGTLMQPRVIVGAVLALGSGLFVACAGVASFLWAHASSVR